MLPRRQPCPGDLVIFVRPFCLPEVLVRRRGAFFDLSSRQEFPMNPSNQAERDWGRLPGHDGISPGFRPGVGPGWAVVDSIEARLRREPEAPNGCWPGMNRY